MFINPIVGVYMPIIRIPIKGEMTIPNTRSGSTLAHMKPIESLWTYYPYQLIRRISPPYPNPRQFYDWSLVEFPTTSSWLRFRIDFLNTSQLHPMSKRITSRHPGARFVQFGYCFDGTPPVPWLHMALRQKWSFHNMKSVFLWYVNEREWTHQVLNASEFGEPFVTELDDNSSVKTFNRKDLHLQKR